MTDETAVERIHKDLQALIIKQQQVVKQVDGRTISKPEASKQLAHNLVYGDMPASEALKKIANWRMFRR